MSALKIEPEYEQWFDRQGQPPSQVRCRQDLVTGVLFSLLLGQGEAVLDYAEGRRHPKDYAQDMAEYEKARADLAQAALGMGMTKAEIMEAQIIAQREFVRPGIK